ncbi:MAG: ABC transporter permease, partial [bacterium]|nr:ABC transporter permease [bacterium]
MENGSFFTEMENKASLRVVVLGQGVAQNLFENENPLGASIRISNVLFEVIGVLASKGVDMYGTDQDDQIFIPIRTALRRVFNQTHLNAIYLQIDQQMNMTPATQSLRELLRKRHRLDLRKKPDDFTIQNQIDLIEAQKETSDTFTMLTASIAAISLLVGGIGILAVMLLAIRERTHEIGLRMAVGARRKDLRTQFLFESSILSLGGGMIGVLTSLLLQWTLAWSISISLFSIFLSFGFS